MNGQQPLDTLDFDDEALLHDEINAIRSREFHTLVDNREVHLPLYVQAGGGEFVMQAGTDSAFEHPGAEGGMYAECTVDYGAAGRIWTERRPTLCVHRVHGGDVTVKQAKGPI